VFIIQHPREGTDRARISYLAEGPRCPPAKAAVQRPVGEQAHKEANCTDAAFSAESIYGIPPKGVLLAGQYACALFRRTPGWTVERYYPPPFPGRLKSSPSFKGCMIL
jgi:hypothetical protein